MHGNDWLVDGPENAAITFVCAHGAGAPMDSPFMNEIALSVAGADIRVVRFEFPYMQKRRADGRRRGPDRMPVLQQTWLDVCKNISGPFVIGGKSMGGRVASMLVGESGAVGCVCLGYPFHPAGKPDKLRIEHLKQVTTPTLILQGTRDPMGKRAEVESYPLEGKLQVHWIEDGDHSFVPRRRSGRTQAQNWREASEQVIRFCRAQVGP